MIAAKPVIVHFKGNQILSPYLILNRKPLIQQQYKDVSPVCQLPALTLYRHRHYTIIYRQGEIMDNILLKPVKMGKYELPNRIFMSPMTRCRADNPENKATPLIAKYYEQRSTAGLITVSYTHLTLPTK